MSFSLEGVPNFYIVRVKKKKKQQPATPLFQRWKFHDPPHALIVGFLWLGFLWLCPLSVSCMCYIHNKKIKKRFARKHFAKFLCLLPCKIVLNWPNITYFPMSFTINLWPPTSPPVLWILLPPTFHIKILWPSLYLRPPSKKIYDNPLVITCGIC